ncbi:class I SAM-dependent methyltransferase [bacterium]|nr:class I SAM-dependent methyltransferase [bacterium]
MKMLQPEHLSCHLDDEQLQTPVETCPFCGSRSRPQVGIVQREPDVYLLKCDRCHASSVSRLPIPEALDRYYNQFFYEQNYSSSHQHQVTFDNTGKFGRHIASVFRSCSGDETIRILDYGGGDGTLALRTAEVLLKKGLKEVAITIVDYGENLVTGSNSAISLQKHSTLEPIKNNMYHLIIASAVLEHLPDPGSILDRLLDLVAPGGLLYARTPDDVPFMKLFTLLGLRWNFVFPAHLHSLGQDFWEYYFRSGTFRSDFSVVLSRPALVETSFRDHFVKTLAAYVFKTPWYLLGQRYNLIGGWEIFSRKQVHSY